MTCRILDCFGAIGGKLAAIALLVLLASQSWAQSGGKKATTSGASPTLGWAIQQESFRRYGLPGNKLYFRLRDELGYNDTEDVTGLMRDLNGDGEAEFLLRGHDRLCGTGGCPYVLVDGKSNRPVGSFTGALVVMHEKQNGFPKIRVISPADEGMVRVLHYGFNIEYLSEESELIDRATLDRFMRQVSRAP